ncbi:MAG: hypothetical protein WC364_04910 [Eubacteriales bacterium]|jgi:stringent starvation protein B
MATLNVDKVNTRQLNGVRLVTGTIDFDSNYQTGGESISVPLNEVKGMLIENKSGFVFQYDRTNKKVLAYWADYDAVTDEALIQVANTTNLSTLTGVAFLAWGW